MGKKSTDNNSAVTLRDIMSTNVVTVSPDLSVVAAAQKMTAEQITCMVVIKDDSVVGIITNNDFMRKIVLKNKEYTDLTVGQIMTTPVISLSDDVTIAKAVQLIDEKRIKHLPVVSNGKLTGIVTQTDFYRASQSELEKKFANLQDQSQAQLEYANSKLEAAVGKTNKDEHEAVVADLAKSHFLANMSHEIRTPLNAIIGLSEVLAEENLTEEQQSHLAIIRESAQNMMVLINDILDFSRIEAGKFNLDISECSLEHLLAVVESLMRPPAMQKGLDFGIFQRTDLPALIKTDPLRLRQCLTNLIYNAIDFTEKGHVFINVFLENINGKECIKFDVEDTGIGIAQEDQQKIFQEFTQVAIVHNRKSAATGLGLTITKKLIGLLGGEINVQSDPGRGSEFSIVIPVGIETKAQPVFNKYDQIKKIKKEKPAQGEVKLSGRILVAEDTPTNQTLIKLLLRKLGLDSVIAEDGKKAVDLALSEEFDLILMDIQMPNMNGYDATRKLREKGFNKPIIAVTAYAMKGDKEKCIAAGCDNYISKPINRTQLVETLKTYMGSQSHQQPAPLEDSADKSADITYELDKATAQIKEMTEMYDDADNENKNINEQTVTLNEEIDPKELIDFKAVTEICDDPEVIKEVAKMFLKDSPRCIKSIAEAIKSSSPKHIKMYAHSLKGASLQIGANKLADFAYQLECAGRDKNMNDVPVLFNAVQDEYSRLTLFLSQPNWLEMAQPK